MNIVNVHLILFGKLYKIAQEIFIKQKYLTEITGYLIN